MLRVGMTNPPYILEHLAVIAGNATAFESSISSCFFSILINFFGIAEVLRHPKVFSFLHIPVQAGSDSVLSAMNREYTAEEFRRVTDYLLVHRTLLCISNLIFIINISTGKRSECYYCDGHYLRVSQ